MNTNLLRQILKNFEVGSKNYNINAEMQLTFAKKLAKKCSLHSIKQGMWVDLGSGTGLLADELEKLHPYQKVLRIDASSAMLQQQSASKRTKVWDLNNGLPPFKSKPDLIASSFSLHWLNNPYERLEEWFDTLSPKGWIALAIPISGTFPEWHYAAHKAGVVCTAIKFPYAEKILAITKPSNIKYLAINSFSQRSSNVISLFKPMLKVGGSTTPSKSLTIKEWRKLIQAWPSQKSDPLFNLTWQIQLLILQK